MRIKADIFSSQVQEWLDRRGWSPEELAKDPEPPHGPQGTDFIVIEYWDSVDDRMTFAKQRTGKSDFVTHLEPDHSHEFFRQISDTVDLP